MSGESLCLLGGACVGADVPGGGLTERDFFWRGLVDYVVDWVCRARDMSAHGAYVGIFVVR